jgi:hypothetical protein
MPRLIGVAVGAFGDPSFSAAGTIRSHSIQARLGWSPQRDARLRYHAVDWEPAGLSLIAWRARLKGKLSATFRPHGLPEPAHSMLAMSYSRCSRSENQVVRRFTGTAWVSSSEAS